MIKKILLSLFALICLIIALFIGAQMVAVSQTKSALTNASSDYTYGNEDGDLTVVEFVKYTCPHCRSLHPVIMEAVKQDGNVRYIPRPLPSEVKDVHLAYAAGEQGLFHLAHGALLKDPRILEDGGIMAIAGTLGLDIKKLKTDMDSSKTQQKINENIQLFLDMGLTRTPTFIIGGDTIFVPEGSPPTVQDFLQLFKEAR